MSDFQDTKSSQQSEEIFGADDYQPVTRAELPRLNDTILDDETLEQLFVDIAALCQILGVTARGHGPQTRASDQNITLSDARELFLARAVNGLQIRYIHAGTEWWDTLMHTPDGTRLVRIAHTWD